MIAKPFDLGVVIIVVSPARLCLRLRSLLVFGPDARLGGSV